MKKNFVAVAGNIGVGKSTLVGLLSERLGWEPFYEPEADNPYLKNFYKNMKKWAFNSQVYFLIHRMRAHRKLLAHPTSAIQDRTIYEDAEVFASNLYQQGNMRKRDYRTYSDLYELLTEMLGPPDLVIYLRATVDTLLERIAQRGRDYEREISPDYLANLNELYEAWIERFSFCPVLTVPADNMNYIAYPGHLDLIVQKVNEKLSGKEEVVFKLEEINNSR